MKKIILIFIPLLFLSGCASQAQKGTSNFAKESQVTSPSSTNPSSEPSDTASKSENNSTRSQPESPTIATPTTWNELSLNQQIALLIQVGNEELAAPANTLSIEEGRKQTLSHEWAMSGTIDNGSILTATPASNDIYRISTQGNIVTVLFGNARPVEKQFTRDDLFTSYYGNVDSQEYTNALAAKIVSPERLEEIIDEKFSSN